MCGWLGETSTEVAGAIDLHPNAKIAGVDEVRQLSGTRISAYKSYGELVVINSGKPCKATIYSVGGKAVMSVSLAEGRNAVATDKLGHGVWIIKSENGSAKFLL